jgi:TonB family protein
LDDAPYIRQVLQTIEKSWSAVLPAAGAYANDAQAETVIRFTISQDGATSAMLLAESAHQIKLDRAAWGSITGAGQLPSLPADFNGPNVVLRIHFRVGASQQ